jgi:carbon storage regulator
MLVLARRVGERICIGPDIEITVVRIGPGNTVRLGINAPPETAIVREELRRLMAAGEHSSDWPPE